MGFIVIFFMISACNLNKKPIEKDTYVLMVNNPRKGSQVSPPRFTGNLKIREIVIVSAYNQRSLTYRLGDNRFKTDFYNEYLIDPEDMFADQLRQWFTDSGLFSKVEFYRGSTGTCYYLDALIEAFYYDLREKNNQRAVLKIAITLDQPSKKPLYYRNFDKQMILKNDKISSLIIAQNQLLGEILVSMEKDLRELSVQPCISL